MGVYQNQIVPLLINWSMRQKNLAAYRSRIIPAAEGRVLEIGIGSGLNLPYYSRNVAHVIGLEPSLRLLAMARRVERTASRPVEFIEGSAEAMRVARVRDEGLADQTVSTQIWHGMRPFVRTGIENIRRTEAFQVYDEGMPFPSPS
jgi:SAM-dependent methyltransferase